MTFDAIEELKKDRRGVDPGDVVAELKFAFWVGLLRPKYDNIPVAEMHLPRISCRWRTPRNSSMGALMLSAASKSRRTSRAHLPQAGHPNACRDHGGHRLDVQTPLPGRPTTAACRWSPP